MENFNHKYPQLAQYLRQKYKKNTKDQVLTWSHFAILALFGLLLKFSFTGQLLLIFSFIAIAALVKGPLMLLYSSIYLFLTKFISATRNSLIDCFIRLILPRIKTQLAVEPHRFFLLRTAVTYDALINV